MELEQRIVIVAKSRGQLFTRDYLVKHAAQIFTSNTAFGNGKANDFSRILVHHHKDPVGLKKN